MTTFKTYEPDNRKPKNNEEDRFQAQCFDHWNKYYRHTSVLFSVPNGQERNFAEVAIALATGLTEGVSDLILCLPGAKAEFLELKTATGRQKKGQKKFEDNVRRLGFDYYLMRTFEQFKEHLTARLGPPNEASNRPATDPTDTGSRRKPSNVQGRSSGRVGTIHRTKP